MLSSAVRRSREMNTPPVSKPPKPSSKLPKPTPNSNAPAIESADTIDPSNPDLISISTDIAKEPTVSVEKLIAIDLREDNAAIVNDKSNIADMMQVHIPFEHGADEGTSEPVILSSTLDESGLPDNEDDEVYQSNGPPPYDPSALHDEYPSNYDDDDYDYETKSDDGGTKVNTQDKKEHESSFVVTNSVADEVGVKQLDYNYGREENLVLLLLYCVGMLVGALNGLTLWLIEKVMLMQATIVNLPNPAAPFFYIGTTAYLVGLSAYICNASKCPAAMGSGIPEVKAMLATDFHPSEYPSVVSLRIHATRIIALIFSVGSSLSIGSASPMVHGAVCTAYSLMKFIPNFSYLKDNPSLSKQIFAAAAAAGLVTVFNAPVGGLLFCVEITTSYYFLSNYWKAFLAATAGGISYSLVLHAREGADRQFDLSYLQSPYDNWELFFYCFLGIISGCIALVYLRVQQRWFIFAKPYMVKNPEACAAMAGMFSAMLICAIGAYGPESMGTNFVVRDALGKGYYAEMSRYGANRIGGVFCSLFIRFILVIVGVSQRIPCGFYGAMVALGSLIGRFYGLIMQAMFGHSIYVSGYAMAGAVAFISGTSHTISGAVIMIEQTGQLDMLLPCLIVAVISSGICKSRSLSLYDQGMVNKALESFQLLLTETGGYKYAHEIFDPDMNYLTSSCKILDLINALSNHKQLIFPVVNDEESKHLVGSISRLDVFRYLKKVFDEGGALNYVTHTLPVDNKIDTDLIRRQQKNEELKHWANKGKSLVNKGLELKEMIVDTFDFKKPKGEEHDSSQTPWNMYNTLDAIDSSIPTSSAGKKELSAEDKALVRTEMMKLFSIASYNHDDHKPDKGYNEEVAADILQQRVDVLFERDLPINGFPFTAQAHTSMDQIYILFEMVSVNCVFIVGDDKDLQGMISKDHLLKELRRKAKKHSM